MSQAVEGHVEYPDGYNVLGASLNMWSPVFCRLGINTYPISYAYLKNIKGLKNVFPLLKESTAILTEEITQLKLNVSIQRDTLDIHKARIAKQDVQR